MKKFVSLLALLLVVCLMASMMAACSKKEEPREPEAETGNEINGTWTEYLVAEKVGVIDRDNFYTEEGGLYYKEDDKYGVISYEGLYDTGAIYASCHAVDKYFAVTTVAPASDTDYAAINTVGLINGKGKEIIPAKYADFYLLNDRYVQAYTATAVTYDEDNYLFDVYDADYERHCYNGTWVIYDLYTGNEVPGATGTTDQLTYAQGKYVVYYDDSEQKYTVDNNGQPLPEGARLMDDGCYTIEGKVGEMYDQDGNLLFNYDLTGFVPRSRVDNYFVASMYTDGGTKNVVMDMTGKVVSAEFPEYIVVCGELILCEETIYNFDGEIVLEGNYEGLDVDPMFGKAYFARMDDTYTMIDAEGNVYYEGEYDDDHIISTYDFVAKKDSGDTGYCYSHADKDYTIEGYIFAPWLVQSSAPNYRYNLVDTMTGDNLLEGYSDYSYIAYNAFAYYVYAEYEGGAEVYLIVSSGQLEEVNQRKENLYNDLANAFTEAGINATVNKESGEITLDTGVLFGGDSAELTADGKAFLDKFIKVYTEIVFSDKYAGFITKTMIEGHTAPVSGANYATDLPLSEERANNVLNYCLAADTGIDPAVLANSFEAVGYANTRPVYDANGEVDMDASRRVSFRFLVSIEFN